MEADHGEPEDRLRDIFAGLAMLGFIVRGSTALPEHMAQRAYVQADAMLFYRRVTEGKRHE